MMITSTLSRFSMKELQINSVPLLNEGTSNVDLVSVGFTGYMGPARVTRTHVCVSKKAKRTNQNKKRINYTKKQVAAASAEEKKPTLLSTPSKWKWKSK